MFLHRTFVVVMDFDQPVNIDGPFCLILVAGSPGFEKVDYQIETAGKSSIDIFLGSDLSRK